MSVCVPLGLIFCRGFGLSISCDSTAPRVRGPHRTAPQCALLVTVSPPPSITERIGNAAMVGATPTNAASMHSSEPPFCCGNAQRFGYPSAAEHGWCWMLGGGRSGPSGRMLPCNS